MNNQTIKFVGAFAVAGLISIGLLQAQSHDHSGDDHAGHDHSGHDHGPADKIEGDGITLSQQLQNELELVMESVEMRALAGSSDDVIALPRSSIVGNGGKFFVYLQDEEEASKFVRAEVTLGQSDDRYVDALTGVFPGDTVIAQGANRIGAPQGREVVQREQDGHFCPLENSRAICDYESRNGGRPSSRGARHDDFEDCPFGDRRRERGERTSDSRHYHEDDRRAPAYDNRGDRDEEHFSSRSRSSRFR